MSAARRPTALALLSLPLLLAACASAESPLSTAPTQAAPTLSATPTANPSPSAVPSPSADVEWRRVSTENGMASISLPPAWTVESDMSDTGFGDVQALWIHDELHREMALLSVGNGGGRGGACDDWFGDGTDDRPARIHLVEEVDVTGGPSGDERPAYLSAATVEYAHGKFEFVAGYSLERPAGDRMPCLIYHDVPTPDGFPLVTLGTPGPDIGGGLWRVDSFDAGQQYTQTEEYATLMEVLRSLRLEAAP